MRTCFLKCRLCNLVSLSHTNTRIALCATHSFNWRSVNKKKRKHETASNTIEPANKQMRGGAAAVHTQQWGPPENMYVIVLPHTEIRCFADMRIVWKFVRSRMRKTEGRIGSRRGMTSATIISLLFVLSNKHFFFLSCSSLCSLIRLHFSSFRTRAATLPTNNNNNQKAQTKYIPLILTLRFDWSLAAGLNKISVFGTFDFFGLLHYAKLASHSQLLSE